MKDDLRSALGNSHRLVTQESSSSFLRRQSTAVCPKFISPVNLECSCGLKGKIYHGHASYPSARSVPREFG